MLFADEWPGPVAPPPVPPTNVSLDRVDACPPGLEVHVLDNGRLRVALLPGAGGRVIGAALDGRELLWRNPRLFPDGLVCLPRSQWPTSDGTLATWANPGGSKVWPAPEGPGADEWPGPPEPVLESGPWDLRDAGAAGSGRTVSLVSPPDERTGLRITRTLTLAPAATGFAEEVVLANVGSRTVRWAAWQVCQVATPALASDRGVVRVGVRPGGAAHLRGASVGTPDVRRASDDELEIPVMGFIGKLGFPGALGDVRYVAPDGAGVRLAVTVSTAGEYPNGSPVDVWFQRPTSDGLGADFRFAHPRDHYVELEACSPLVSIAPGESVRSTFAWQFRPPAPDSDGARAAGSAEGQRHAERRSPANGRTAG